MKRLIVLLVSQLFVTPAFADFDSDMKSIKEGIKEITRQRDEAIMQRDYWANRDCQDKYVMRFPQWDNTSGTSDKATVLQIEEGADSKTEYTVITSSSPGISICILKVGDECILKYDGISQTFIASRTLNVSVKAPK